MIMISTYSTMHRVLLTCRSRRNCQADVAVVFDSRSFVLTGSYMELQTIYTVRHFSVFNRKDKLADVWYT